MTHQCPRPLKQLLQKARRDLDPVGRSGEANKFAGGVFSIPKEIGCKDMLLKRKTGGRESTRSESRAQIPENQSLRTLLRPGTAALRHFGGKEAQILRTFSTEQSLLASAATIFETGS